MANEIRTRYSSTGATIYRQIVRASDGYIYNGTSFSAVPTAASWSSYSSALVEQSTTQYYYGGFPAVAAGLYNVYLYLQSGGLSATTDTLLEVQTIDWKGSAEVTLSGLTFTVAGNLDCNVQYVNDVQVTGTGASGDEWGPP